MGAAESASPITSYSWGVEPQYDANFSDLALNDPTTPQLVVKGGVLRPGIPYKFRLSATNREGTGRPTKGHLALELETLLLFSP